MKTILIIVVAFAGSYFLIKNSFSNKNDKQKSSQHIAESIKMDQKVNLRIDFLQDVSGSIQKNGVQLVSSSLFAPLFANLNRSIEINFGCISDWSCEKLITIRLPAAHFKRPDIPDLHNISLLKKKERNEEYERLLGQYNTDSNYYFVKRIFAISEFSHRVDSLVGTFRNNLTRRTDLATALEVADRVFNTPTSEPTKNVIIANTDGLDTYRRSISKLRNNDLVIVTNSGRNHETSIEKITTLKLQSPEEAIEFLFTKYLN